MRVAVLGGVAFVLFAIVFFRLWFLQVLSGEDFVSQARENRVRKVRIEAPRGDVVDRNGTVLVKTRVAPVVQIVPARCPTRCSRRRTSSASSAASRRRRAWRPPRQLRALERDIRERRHGAAAASAASAAGWPAPPAARRRCRSCRRPPTRPSCAASTASSGA